MGWMGPSPLPDEGSLSAPPCCMTTRLPLLPRTFLLPWPWISEAAHLGCGCGRNENYAEPEQESGIGCGGLRIGFDNYIDFRVLFQLHLFAVLILQNIVDTNLFIEVIGIPHFNFRFFRQARVNWLDDFSNPAGFNGFWFFHAPPGTER